jgi:hypothetical protein
MILRRQSGGIPWSQLQERFTHGSRRRVGPGPPESGGVRSHPVLTFAPPTLVGVEAQVAEELAKNFSLPVDTSSL